VPNVLFELIAGGMLASVLVPTFVGEQAKGRERTSEIASTLANALLLVSVPLVLIGVVFARPLMELRLVGVHDPDVRVRQVELGSWFLRFFLPQIPLYLLGIVMQGVLHAHRRFVVPALGPLLSSLTVIATYVAFRRMQPGADLRTVSDAQLWVLAGGTTLGVFVLTFSQLPSVLRLGVRWRAVLSWRDPTIRKALRAGGWGAGFLGLTQLILVVAVMLANRVEGGVVAFQIANAFFELPNALIGLPVAISLFPALSEAYVRRDESRFAELLSNGWRLVLFGALPAAVGLHLLSTPITEVLLGWAPDVRPALVAGALQGLAVGVPAWLVIGSLVRALYARAATARPFVMIAVAFAAVLVVGVGGSAVVFPSGVGPGGVSVAAMRILGGAISSGWILAALAGVLLLARIAPAWSARAAAGVLAEAAAIAAVMGLAVWGVLRMLAGAPQVVRLAAGAAAGAVVVGAFALRSKDLRMSLASLGARQQTR
jgi:putative peptidoglycan lipid II flippase